MLRERTSDDDGDGDDDDDDDDDDNGRSQGRRIGGFTAVSRLDLTIIRHRDGGLGRGVACVRG